MSTSARFTAEITVRYADTDANGHVFFANYLTYFDIALLEYLKAIGYGFERFTRDGLNLYYIDAQCRYHAGARFDERLQVAVTIDHFGTTSFRASCTTRNSADGRLINTGRLVTVVVETAGERKVPLPDGFREAVRRFEALGQEVVNRKQ